MKQKYTKHNDNTYNDKKEKNQRTWRTIFNEKKS